MKRRSLVKLIKETAKTKGKLTNAQKQDRYRKRNEQVLRFYEETTGMDRDIVRIIVKVIEFNMRMEKYKNEKKKI